MERAHIDISRKLHGESVVFVCVDLDEKEVAASAHAVAATAAERFRNSTMSSDDVLELRELTALADEMSELALRGAGSRVVWPPARLSAYRDAISRFVATRDQAEWIRGEDREPLALLRRMLFPLDQLHAEAMRAVPSPARAS